MRRWRGLPRQPAETGSQALLAALLVLSEHQPQTARPVALAFLQVPPCRPGGAAPGPPVPDPSRLHHPGDSRALPAAQPLPAQQLLLLPDLAALHPDRRSLLSNPLHDTSPAGQRQHQPSCPAAPQNARERATLPAGGRQPPDAGCQHQTRATGAGPDVP